MFRPRGGQSLLFSIHRGIRAYLLAAIPSLASDFLFLFLFFFSVTPFDKTCWPILTYNSSNGAAWPKEVPFRVSITTIQILGGLRAPKSPKFAPV